MVCAVDFYSTPTKEIAIAGSEESEPVKKFLLALHTRYVPNKVVAVLDPRAVESAALEKEIPLLKGKTLVDGAPAVYVCKDFACRKPVTTAAAFVELLQTDMKGSA